ncbi:MAG: hypothetical protein Tsb0020_46280 [Haliangiales bacterium]
MESYLDALVDNQASVTRRALDSVRQFPDSRSTVFDTCWQKMPTRAREALAASRAMPPVGRRLSVVGRGPTDARQMLDSIWPLLDSI